MTEILFAVGVLSCVGLLIWLLCRNPPFTEDIECELCGDTPREDDTVTLRHNGSVVCDSCIQWQRSHPEDD